MVSAARMISAGNFGAIAWALARARKTGRSSVRGFAAAAIAISSRSAGEIRNS
jgi:hypothetical protein